MANPEMEVRLSLTLPEPDGKIIGDYKVRKPGDLASYLQELIDGDVELEGFNAGRLLASGKVTAQLIIQIS